MREAAHTTIAGITASRHTTGGRTDVCADPPRTQLRIWDTETNQCPNAEAPALARALPPRYAPDWSIRPRSPGVPHNSPVLGGCPHRPTTGVLCRRLYRSHTPRTRRIRGVAAELAGAHYRRHRPPSARP